MPEIIGITLACLIVAAIAAYFIFDGIIEKKERARCQQLFRTPVGFVIHAKLIRTFQQAKTF